MNPEIFETLKPALNICAIDTSGRNGSLALVRCTVSDNVGNFETLHVQALVGGSYSADLIPVLIDALSKCGFNRSDIDLLVIANGPGSFTGLRVGISTVKALSEALQIPIVEISVLECIALLTQSATPLVVLDAQRSEVYVGQFEIDSSIGVFPLKSSHEALATITGFIGWMGAQQPVPVAYTPDPSVERKIIESGYSVQFIDRPSAEVYARFGAKKYLAGKVSDTESLDANYIRRSDAEIFSASKITGKA